SGSRPGANEMRCFVASDFHWLTSAVPCAAWSWLPAASTAAHSAVRHEATLPAPQKRVLYGALTCLASRVDRSLRRIHQRPLVWPLPVSDPTSDDSCVPSALPSTGLSALS